MSLSIGSELVFLTRFEYRDNDRNEAPPDSPWIYEPLTYVDPCTRCKLAVPRYVNAALADAVLVLNANCGSPSCRAYHYLDDAELSNFSARHSQLYTLFNRLCRVTWAPLLGKRMRGSSIRSFRRNAVFHGIFEYVRHDAPMTGDKLPRYRER